MARVLFFIFFLSFSSHAEIVTQFQSETMKVGVEKLKDDLDVVWGFDFLDKDQIIFTERDSGKIKVLNLITKKVSEVSGVPQSQSGGQGGLLDIVKHPDFQKNKFIYLSYVKKVGVNRTTALVRAKLVGNQMTEVKEIFLAKPASGKTIHFGSRTVILPNGDLFLTIGDRGERKNAQRLDTHTGKVIRIRDDGSIPKDNPFLKQKGALPEIWSYGHRNPQGLVYDSRSKTLYEMEHGPRGGDEINVVEKSKNYGWPVITYGKEYWGPSIGQKSKVGMEQPIKYFTPSIAPCGLMIYQGDVFPKWKGSLFSGALKLTHLNRVSIRDGKVIAEERLLDDFGERIRDVAQGPDGLIYFSTDSGRIYRLLNQSNR